MGLISVGKQLLINLAIAWICVLTNGVARADCSAGFDTRYVTFDMGPHYVPRDAPLGSVIGTARQLYTYVLPASINCVRGDALTTRSNFPTVRDITLPTPWAKATVSKTNIPGVGMVVETKWYAVSVFEQISGTYGFVPYSVTLKQSSGMLTYPISVIFTLVKTSHDIPAGTTRLVNGTSAIKFESGAKNLFSVFVTGSVERSECFLPNSGVGGKTYIDVAMGDVQRREFNGKDSYLASKGFTIPLTSCVAGTYPTNQSWNFYQNSNVNIKFEGAGGSPIIDASKGVVGLTSDSTAKGVAVQIMRKDGVTPLKLNEEVSIAEVTGTSMNIDLKARYIQTSESPLGPEPGVANAKAAFTVTYK